MESLWVAVVMGVVEGVTEFLPVSSTGHLIIAGHLLDFKGDKAASFEVFIQLGAILAVVALYWRVFLGLIPKKRFKPPLTGGFEGWRGLWLLFLTTLPALIIGAMAHSSIKFYLFSPLTVAFALGIGGVAILLVERHKPEPTVMELDALDAKRALMIGLFQCIAMWPGVSRSASTIIGGMLGGLDRRTATEYSFLAAVPVMIAATGYDFLKIRASLGYDDLWFFGVGFVVSFIFAAISIKTFIGLVKRWSLAPYAIYRIIIAPVIYFTMT
jgi:undecaprenyl-diphosphatase